jgi:hypothetical protein
MRGKVPYGRLYIRWHGGHHGGRLGAYPRAATFFMQVTLLHVSLGLQCLTATQLILKFVARGGKVGEARGNPTHVVCPTANSWRAMKETTLVYLC